jgi:hypothetical protein
MDFGSVAATLGLLKLTREFRNRRRTRVQLPDNLPRAPLNVNSERPSFGISEL